jgi:hypothetical protein
MDEVEERLKCKYELEYYDHFSKKPEIFRCGEDAVKDGYCIFHHPEYWKEHKDEVREKFMYKVEDAIKNKKGTALHRLQLT